MPRPTVGDWLIELLADGTPIASLHGAISDLVRGVYVQRSVEFETSPSVSAGQALGIRVTLIGSQLFTDLVWDDFQLTAEPIPSIHYMEYKTKESDKKALNGSLAKGCVLTLDDALFDFDDGESTSEDYNISKNVSLGLPADKNSENTVDLEGTHLLGFKVKAAKLGVLPVVDGKFQKGRKHAKRFGVEVTIENPTLHDGSGSNTIYLNTKKVTRLLVPANKDLASVPLVPSGTDHYKCYKAKTTRTAPFGTLQDAKGKELKHLQVTIEDQFADGNSHPTYDNARLFDLKKVTEICNPVSKDNIETLEMDDNGNTRVSTCSVAPATILDPNTSLICWQAKRASKAYTQPWDGVDKGTKIDPKQGKHVKRSLKDGTPLYVGHQLTAPDRLNTIKELHFCLPAMVTDVGTTTKP